MPLPVISGISVPLPGLPTASYTPGALLHAVDPEFLDRIGAGVIQVEDGSSGDEDLGGIGKRGIGRAIAEAEGSFVDGGIAGVGIGAGERQAADAVLGEAAAGGDAVGEQGLRDGDVLAGRHVEPCAAGLDEGIGQAADVVALAASGRRVPPSKLSVAVELVPRAVGKRGQRHVGGAADVDDGRVGVAGGKTRKALAENVPPVSVSVDVTPVLPAVLPPMDRVLTFAVPPVWLNKFVVLFAVPALSERPI